MYLAKKQVQILRETRAAIHIQKSWRMHVARSNFLEMRNVAIKIQSWVRMKSARTSYLRLVAKRHQSAILIQSYFRRHLAQKKLENLKRNRAATILQSHWR